MKSVFHKSPIILVLIFAGTHGQSEKYLLFNRRSFFLSQLESQFWHFQLGRPHQMCLWGDHYHIFTVLHGFHVDITKFAIHPLDSSALPTGLLSFPGFSSWKGKTFQFRLPTSTSVKVHLYSEGQSRLVQDEPWGPQQLTQAASTLSLINIIS